MSSPFLGQIEVFGFGFAPKNWVQCRGQLLPIQQYQALFALLGTTFGGNGVNNFALPNLQSRVPVGAGKDQSGVAWVQGQIGGSESIALTAGQIPAHTHTVKASGNTDVTNNAFLPNNSVGLGQSTGMGTDGKPMAVNAFAPVGSATDFVALHASAINAGGAAQPHENRMPSLVMNFCISLAGVFPSRN